MTPLVSIIIPTANRPHYLSRAIDSALKGLSIGEIEVIVVPNGPDITWKETLRPYAKTDSVRVVTSSPPNASIARNSGLRVARGKFIRFLDDDDYLFPESAIKQYALLQESGVDVVSGNIELIDPKGLSLGKQIQPETADFCSAALGSNRLNLIHAHVYKRTFLTGVEWNPRVEIHDDLEWQYSICAKSEVNWIKFQEIVGIWQQHLGQRISKSLSIQNSREVIVKLILNLYSQLKTNGRLTDERRRATSQGLWGCIHDAFPLEPKYWKNISNIAKSIDPDSRPHQRIYQYPFFRNLDPLTIQWLLFPKRYAFRKYHNFQRKYQLKH